ncbi:MAG: hypothetical protein QNK11_06970 [Legionella sp.]|nr:hypothetical protein [Legionella sp.]
MKKASALEQEIAALREEVQVLRQEKFKSTSKSKTQSKPKPTISLETEFKQILTETLTQVKKDCDNLSPVTALLLFSLGVMLGRVLAKNKGGR